MLLKSRSLRMAVASLLLVMGMGVAVPAMADDGIEPYHHEDTDFHFNLGVYGAGMTAGTAGEQKDETSPLFIYPTDITFDKCKVYGEGSHDQYGPWTDGDILTVNEFGILYWSDTDERLLLKTDIKECGYSWARLTAYQWSLPGYVTGVWSPDSYAGNGSIINNGWR